MKQAEVPASFKKPEDRMWGKYERRQNARASQERKNVVLDHLGGGDHAWQYILERNASKRNVELVILIRMELPILLLEKSKLIVKLFYSLQMKMVRRKVFSNLI